MERRPSKQAIRTWARLVRVESTLIDQVDIALKSAGLPLLAWYDVLLELHRSPDGELRQYEIGERILLTKYNLSRLIDRLQSEGFVERLSCPQDGRGNIVRITTSGVTLLKRIWPVYGTVIREQFEHKLTSKEMMALGEILNKLTARPAEVQA